MPPGQPVRIETERLILDAHTVEDFEPLAAMWADPEVVRHISGRPSSAQDSWMRLLRYGGTWPLLGYGYWAVREKSSRRFVGDLGFADFHRQIEPPITGVPEAGWVFATWAHGRGFATEALHAALAWLDTRASIARSVCLIAPENKISIRLAERSGYLRSATVSFSGADTLLYARNRSFFGSNGDSSMTVAL
jgi:RimJ/RimL family protein N-acetyltransferase